MEQHPVPQNVTTFQFRLIGDMTVKQFGYLIGGGIAAFICYKLPLPEIFTWPLAGIFGLLGIGLAFVPIEERPMDVWILSFLKNVYSPTQFLWQKDGPHTPVISTAPPKIVPPQAIIPQTEALPKPSAPAHPHGPTWQERLSMLFFQNKPHAPTVPQMPIPQTPAPIPHHVPVSPPPTPPSPKPPGQPPAATVGPAEPIPAVAGQHMDVPGFTSPATKPPPDTQELEHMQEKLQALQKELQGHQLSQDRIAELQKQLMDVLSEKQTMEKELIALRQQASSPPRPPEPTKIAPSVPIPAPPPKPTVSVIDQPGAAVRAGIPRLTTFPNIPTGIIKDVDGNLLPAILVTIKDKDDVPLRALKTNKLGQFAASTQMSNGVYLVEAEDPRGRFVFDRAQITINGSIMPALEITAKSPKQLNRDKMAKELFGNTMK